jgi:hypothetical protein
MIIACCHASFLVLLRGVFVIWHREVVDGLLNLTLQSFDGLFGIFDLGRKFVLKRFDLVLKLLHTATDVILKRIHGVVDSIEKISTWMATFAQSGNDGIRGNNET